MMHDKILIEKRFGKALHRYHTMAVVQRSIASRLARAIPEHQYGTVLEIGAGSGFLTEQLIAKFPHAQLIANDITMQSREFLPSNIEFIAADGETLPIPIGTQLIASSSTVQWFDNLPQFINRAYDALPTGGTLAISTFGIDNFCQIESSLEYYSLSELQQIAQQAGFNITHSEEWHENMVFDSPVEVLKHIKATGVNAISSTRWTSRRLQEFIVHYPKPAILTFHPIIIILCKQ